MPVAMARIFGSKMMSSGFMHTFCVRMRYARCAISILRSKVVACPCSSKHITTHAAPKRFKARACSMNCSSPSFSEIELTIHLPCTHLRPAMMTSHLEESIMMGTRAMSGSAAIMLRNVVISFSASSRPSSMLMSSTNAPSLTCLRAILIASSYCPSLISRRNFLLPATLHRSPTLTKLTSGVTFSISRPESQSVLGLLTTACGVLPLAKAA